jgi:hypothetical protein
MYKLFNSVTHEKFVIRLADNAFIPTDLANSDYIAFLKWIEEGNTPTSADEGTQ